MGFVVNGVLANAKTFLRNLRLRHSIFFCLSKRKSGKKKASPGGDFSPGTPLKRPEKPKRFFWTFPAKLEAVQNFRRCSYRRCRGRCPHRPGRMHRFYGNLRRIRNFPVGRCGHRPLQGFGESVLPCKFRTQDVFTAAIQRQLLTTVVYRNRRRVPKRP